MRDGWMARALVLVIENRGAVSGPIKVGTGPAHGTGGGPSTAGCTRSSSARCEHNAQHMVQRASEGSHRGPTLAKTIKELKRWKSRGGCRLSCSQTRAPPRAHIQFSQYIAAGCPSAVESFETRQAGQSSSSHKVPLCRKREAARGVCQWTDEEVRRAERLDSSSKRLRVVVGELACNPGGSCKLQS